MLTLSQPEGADYAHHIDFVLPKKSHDYTPAIHNVKEGLLSFDQNPLSHWVSGFSSNQGK